MNTINKLRLCLLAMLTLVAINSLADELVLDRSTISFNSSAHENILFKVKSDTGWMVDVTDPAGERIDWLYDINPASGDATGDGWATVTLKAKENESTEDRHATIIVKAGEASESISIIQYGKVVELVLSTDKLSFGQPAGDRTFTVTSNVAWTVKSSDESWLTITNNNSGEGNEAAPVTVTVHAEENTNSDSRPAKITVSGGGTSQTIEVTQLGKEANISLSTDKLSFGQPAGDCTFTVTSNVKWEVKTDKEWLTITKNDSGEGNEPSPVTVTVHAKENTNSDSRPAKITVSGGGTSQTIEVTQFGYAPYIVLNVHQLSFAVPGGEYEIEVATNVEWQLSEVSYKGEQNIEWLTITKEDGKIKVSASENSAPTNRTATFTVNGEGLQPVTVTVSQFGLTPDLKLSTNTLNFGVEGGPKTFDVASNVNWTVTCDAKWLSIKEPENGEGKDNATVIIEAKENHGPKRTAQVSVRWNNGIKDKFNTITITQLGNEPDLKVSTDKILFDYKGGDGSFEIASNVSWKVESLADWLTIKDPENGSGKDTYKVAVEAETNPGDTRETQVTVTWNDGKEDVVETITITQLGNTPGLKVNNKALLIENGSASFDIVSNVSWKVKSLVDWLTIKEPENGEGRDNATVTIEAKEDSETTREGQVTVTWNDGKEDIVETITVTQFSNDLELTVNTNETRIGDDRTASFEVFSNVNWKVESLVDWLTIKEPENGEGKNNAKVTVEAEENDGPTRYGQVTVTWNDGKEEKNETITVIQIGTEKDLSIGINDSPRFVYEGGEKQFDITSNVKWNIVSSDDSWLVITDPENGEGQNNYTVKYEAKKNGGAERTANIIVTWNNGSVDVNDTIIVTQQAAPTSIEIKPKTVNLFKDGGEFTIDVSTSIDSWEASSEKGWVEINGNKEYKGKKTEKLKITIEKNEGEERQSAIAFSWETEEGEKKDSVIIKQGGKEEFKFEIVDDKHSDGTLHSDVSGGNFEIVVTGVNTDWKPEIGGNKSWVSITSVVVTKSDKTSVEKQIFLHINPNSEYKEHSAEIKIDYYDGYGNLNTVSLPIEQRARPQIPDFIKLADDNDGFFTPEAGKEATFKVSTDNPTPDFVRDEWALKWDIDGTTIEKDGLSCNYSISKTRPQKPLDGKVTLYYKNYPSENSKEISFEIYPSPVAPAKLVLKGNGNSGILIATFEGLSDSEMKDYSFVFGYDNKECTTKGYNYRYYQYGNSIVADNNKEKWVRTQWEIAGKPIQSCRIEYDSNTRASDTGISSVEQADVMLRHGHLVANVSAPVSATAEIVAMSGATVRRIDFEPRCIFDEQIDLNGLPSGLYIVRCNIGDKKIEEKMVIR